MVAHLMRMRLALAVNGWRRSTFQLVLAILAMLYAVAMLGLWGIGAAALAQLEVPLRGTVLVLAGALVVVAWMTIPVFLTGVDLTLDPAAFATFGIPTRTLVAGLALAGLVTVPGAATLAAWLLSCLAWTDAPAALVAAVPAAVLGALTCVCLSHAVTGLLAAYTGRRRIREVISLVAIVPLMFGGLAVSAVAGSVADALHALPGLARGLAWTPLGSFAAVPWSVAEGRWAEAAGQGLLCLAWLAGALRLWQAAVDRAAERVGTAGAGGRPPRTGPGLLGILPATPAGAIAARSLLYWVRDPRYTASLVVIPLLAVLFWLLGAQSGDHVMVLVVGPLTGFLLGYAISADIAYDGSAFALHVTSGVSGRDDRTGRVGALLLWAVPVTTMVTVLTAWPAGAWTVLPGLLGVALGALLTGAGVSAVSSARFIYPVPKPGASPFATPEGSVLRVMVVSLGALVVIGLLTLPELALFAAGLVTGSVLLHWLSLAAGLACGSLVLWLGIRVGGRWFDRAQAETYQSVLDFA
ncbi:Tat (twin-arginine translocation) pathway signal sequence [Citricoccus sp. SGAir0253]|uniref:Tat (twin-arginine translocation) pathway signal sequence n=1 Tax=Citricoccus sp. SGAir0253 TaxID=2567881 RepID=UPI0010CD4210|nr:Tat (twin-arginine translocation) pathway signal sequence [Citricoccus sp. SGAir0253]QCU78403.1 Tat (twin-arginine translocation) pathway signal sequence [Citricoccus sp. SGAir0253]